MNCHAVFNCVGHNHELSDNRLIKETVLKYVNEAEFKELFTIAALEKIETVTSSAIAATSSAIKASLDARNAVNDLTIQTIDFVNDAINNTAIEGGVLADTFVVVDATLSQRQINRGFDSIADMLSINNPKDGLRVTVKGSQGGSFEYNSSKSTLNDGGTVFNGWVRIHFLTHNLVEWFGAKWDGTDTTATLDKAIIESAKTKTPLNFGGSDRTYTVNTMRNTSGWQVSSFFVQDNMHLFGQGCKIIADNRSVSMPEEDHAWYYRFFTINTSMGTRENVSIIGIDFDTQFDKYPDDKHRIGGFLSSAGIVNHVLIKNCNFYHSSGTNAIGIFLTASSTVLAKDWKVLDCQFINSGYGGDFTAVYLMVDDAEVKVDVLQRFNDPVKNMMCSNAIEVHGSNQNVHHCLVDKVAGGIIAGVGKFENVKNTLISDNIVNTYTSGITIWNGEGSSSLGHADVSILNNVVRVLPYYKVSGRKGIGGGILGASVLSLTVSGNTVTCEDASDATNLATPIYFNYNTEGSGYALIGNLNITNNTTSGGHGILVGSTKRNHTILDAYIMNNSISITHSMVGVTSVGVHVRNPPASDTLNNRSVVVTGNVVNSKYPEAQAFKIEGQVGALTLDNIAQRTIKKYDIVDEPATYVDCENLKSPTNIHKSVVLLGANQIKFKVNLASLRVSGSSSGFVLCTLPEGAKISGAYVKQLTAVTGATSAAISIGDSSGSETYLKKAELSSSTGSVMYGVATAEKGSYLSTNTGHYLSTLSSISLFATATSLADITGQAEVTINYSYI